MAAGDNNRDSLSLRAATRPPSSLPHAAPATAPPRNAGLGAGLRGARGPSTRAPRSTIEASPRSEASTPSNSETGSSRSLPSHQEDTNQSEGLPERGESVPGLLRPRSPSPAVDAHDRPLRRDRGESRMIWRLYPYEKQGTASKPRGRRAASAGVVRAPPCLRSVEGFPGETRRRTPRSRRWEVARFDKGGVPGAVGKMRGDTNTL